MTMESKLEQLEPLMIGLPKAAQRGGFQKLDV
jgi:hypothetical protein